MTSTSLTYSALITLEQMLALQATQAPLVLLDCSFDLADLGLSEARYVRLLDVSVAYYGDRMWCGGGGGGFDLDAIAVVHGNAP